MEAIDGSEVAISLSPSVFGRMQQMRPQACIGWLKALECLEPGKQSRQIVAIDDVQIANELEDAGLVRPYMHMKRKIPGKYIIPRSVAFASLVPMVCSDEGLRED